MFRMFLSNRSLHFVFVSIVILCYSEVFSLESFQMVSRQKRDYRHYHRSGPHDQQQEQQQLPYDGSPSFLHELVIDDKAHKCLFEVPSITLNQRNYPHFRFVSSSNRSHFSRIEACCSDYRTVLIKSRTVCLPRCTNCVNGDCIAPGKCECYDGFVENDNGDCIFVCPLDCLNGRCYLDGTCRCNPGYALDVTRKFCRPICSRGCAEHVHQNCTEPETCACQKGYTLREYGCQPICDPDCGVGGDCKAPNKCECKFGYKLKLGVCQEKCYQNCLNGVCQMRNRCICNLGYRYHEPSMSCIPCS